MFQPVVGIVYNPVVNDFYSAVKRQGAFCNGQKLRANETEGYSLSQISELIC
jgi:fructose-1,6-bisphosphatase/inositol monophosphatase family enzyme